jgi:Glycosyltransferase like family
VSKLLKQLLLGLGHFLWWKIAPTGKPAPPDVATTRFRLVCATRESLANFAENTSLGKSLRMCPYPRIELRLFPENTLGLPHVYNIAIEEAKKDPAILIFIHDDVELLDFFWPYHVLEGLKSFDVIGLAGNKRRIPGQPAWCFIETKTWTRDDKANLSGMVPWGSTWPPHGQGYFGPTCQPVKLLDGVLLACASETLVASGLAFDERFEFHFYDMDFCRQAERANLRMGTWSIALVHASNAPFGTPAWWDGYSRYIEKWQS